LYALTANISFSLLFGLIALINTLILYGQLQTPSKQLKAARFQRSIQVLFSIFILAFTVLPSLPLVTEIKDNLTSFKYRAYLEKNKLNVDIEDSVFNFEPKFYKNKLFILSEDHGYSGPQQLDFALLTHLHKKTGLQYYLGEIDPAESCAFNTYINGGSDKFVKQVFNRFYVEKLQWANRDFYQKLTKIRAYNAKLADADRINFIGVDRIRDMTFANQIVAICESSSSKNLLRQAIAQEKHSSKDRYASIDRNIEKAYSLYKLDNEQLYGLWGTFHGMQTSVNEIKPLAMRLAEKPQFRNAVITLRSAFASESSSMMPTEALPSPLTKGSTAQYSNVPANMDSPHVYYLSGINDLKKVSADTKVSIFKLDQDKSPYFSGRRLTNAGGLVSLIMPFRMNAPAAKSFQYIVLFQGTPPLTPWRGEAFAGI
jgi:hypothetical protein